MRAKLSRFIPLVAILMAGFPIALRAAAIVAVGVDENDSPLANLFQPKAL
jgi:hypothetical protein